MIGSGYQFPRLTGEHHNKLREWYKTHNNGQCSGEGHGAIGGDITFTIVPTSIGDIVTATCSCGESIDLMKI